MLGVPVLTGFLIYYLTRLRTPADANGVAIEILAGYGVIRLVNRLVRFWTRPLRDGAFLGDWTLDFSPTGRAHAAPSLHLVRYGRCICNSRTRLGGWYEQGKRPIDPS
jgi:hypothetical protein